MKETPRNPRLRAMTTAFDRKTIALNVVEHQTLIFRSFEDIVRFMNCLCQPSYETLIVDFTNPESVLVTWTKRLREVDVGRHWT